MRDPLSMIDDWLCSGNPEEREVCAEHGEMRPCAVCLMAELEFKAEMVREERDG